MWKNLFRIGLIGSVIGAICCVTPVLGILLAGLGISLALSLDLIVIPAFLFFLGLTLLAWAMMRRTRS